MTIISNVIGFGILLTVICIFVYTGCCICQGREERILTVDGYSILRSGDENV